MTTRRGLFKLLAGALASPALAPLAKLLPAPERMISYHTYLTNDTSLFTIDLDFLRRNLPMTRMCLDYNLPPRSGQTIRFFTYIPEPASERHT